MAEKAPIRKHLSPSAPLSLAFDNEKGDGVDVLQFNLAYDFNAFALIEGRTGLNVLKAELFKNINATNIRVLFWGALQLYHPEFEGDNGLEVAGSYINFENSKDIAQVLKKAFLLSLPKARREQIEAAEAAENAPKPEGAPADPQPAETTK
jgi:hypothetical protein